MAAPAHIARENGKKGGRPKGSTTRPQIRDYFAEKEIAALVSELKERAKTDSMILKFLAEQVFGKAPQPLTGPGGGAIQIEGVEITVRKS
jgi:hypothetical protein